MFRLHSHSTARILRRLLSSTILAVAILSAAGNASAQLRDEMLPRHARVESKWRKVWNWSAAALIAGSAMDVASSYGFQEANPLLRSGNGQLNARGTGLKFGILAGALVGQYYLLKKYPDLEKPLAVTNFAVGAAYTGVAVRNWRVR